VISSIPVLWCSVLIPAIYGLDAIANRKIYETYMHSDQIAYPGKPKHYKLLGVQCGGWGKVVMEIRMEDRQK